MITIEQLMETMKKEDEAKQLIEAMKKEQEEEDYDYPEVISLDIEPKKIESKKIIFRLDIRKIKKIRRIAVETDRPLKAVFTEGVDLVIEKYKDIAS